MTWSNLTGPSTREWNFAASPFAVFPSCSLSLPSSGRCIFPGKTKFPAAIILFSRKIVNHRIAHHRYLTILILNFYSSFMSGLFNLSNCSFWLNCWISSFTSNWTEVIFTFSVTCFIFLILFMLFYFEFLFLCVFVSVFWRRKWQAMEVLRGKVCLCRILLSVRGGRPRMAAPTLYEDRFRHLVLCRFTYHLYNYFPEF